MIGSSASGSDISRDLVGVAKEVHVASRTIADEKIGKDPGYDNMWLHFMVTIALRQNFGWLLRTVKMLIMFKLIIQIKSVHRDGSVIFHDGSVVFADLILHCTGYAL